MCTFWNEKNCYQKMVRRLALQSAWISPASGTRSCVALGNLLDLICKMGTIVSLPHSTVAWIKFQAAFLVSSR